VLFLNETFYVYTIVVCIILDSQDRVYGGMKGNQVV